MGLKGEERRVSKGGRACMEGSLTYPTRYLSVFFFGVMEVSLGGRGKKRLVINLRATVLLEKDLYFIKS